MLANMILHWLLFLSSEIRFQSSPLRVKQTVIMEPLFGRSFMGWISIVGHQGIKQHDLGVGLGKSEIEVNHSTPLRIRSFLFELGVVRKVSDGLPDV